MIAALLVGLVFSANANPVEPRDLNSIILSAALGRSTNGAEEAIYKISSSKDVVMYLSGTTPVKDWTMCAHGLSGDARMAVGKGNSLLEINALSFSLPVCNLKGEHSAMDQDAYCALKADRYKEIVFRLLSATVRPTGKNSSSIEALGNLTVAGVTRSVTLRMQSQVSPDGSITFSGSEKLRMSDYKVERPSVLFGVIKADDNMTLSYTLIFSKQEHPL